MSMTFQNYRRLWLPLLSPLPQSLEEVIAGLLAFPLGLLGEPLGPSDPCWTRSQFFTDGHNTLCTMQYAGGGGVADSYLPQAHG